MPRMRWLHTGNQPVPVQPRLTVRAPRWPRGMDGKWDNCETMHKPLPLKKKDLFLGFSGCIHHRLCCTQMPAQPVTYHRKGLHGQMQTVIWYLCLARGLGADGLLKSFRCISRDLCQDHLSLGRGTSLCRCTLAWHCWSLICAYTAQLNWPSVHTGIQIMIC